MLDYCRALGKGLLRQHLERRPPPDRARHRALLSHQILEAELAMQSQFT